MDSAKSDFLSRKIPDGFNPERQEDRHKLLIPAGATKPGRKMQGAIRAAIADQISAEDPPETWATAQRLLDMGLSNDEVMSQLTLTLTTRLMVEQESEEPFDPSAYRDALARLPLPSASKIAECWESVVRSLHQVVPEEGRHRLLELLEKQPDDPAVDALLERVLDELIEREVMDVLVDSRLVHLDDLHSEIWMSHSMTAQEVEGGFIEGTGDLSSFRRYRQLTLAGGGEIEVDSDPDLLWWMPQGWMKRFSEGDLVAVSVGADGVVQIVPADPVEDPDLVERLRRHYDASVGELELPVYLKDLVTALLAEKRDTFSRPQWPLDDLVIAAGLEREGPMVAHDDDLWNSWAVFLLVGRASERMGGDESATHKAMSVIALALDTERTAEELKEALKALSDLELAEFVVDEMTSVLFADDDGADRTHGFVADLLLTGRTGLPRAVAGWVAALVAEKEGDCITAEAHLKNSVASGAE